LAPAADPWTPARPHAFFDEIAKPPNSLRIAFSTDAPAGKTDPQCILAIHTVVHALETLGHLVDEATPDWAELAPAAAIPMSAPGPADLIDLADAQKVEPRNVQMIQRAAAMTMLEHSRLVDATRAATRRFMPFWDKYDILVSPASGMLTPPVDETLWELDAQTRNARIGGFPLWARPFNITGQPAISVPVAWTSTGLPIGVQLAGRHLDEALLLRVAAQLEQEFPWAERLKKLAASL
jgi:Asp-tRNA(Asn)/Glu-tRNA(Gln) amidotransferase A subunit family amidase